jgi:hypothetical protein
MNWTVKLLQMVYTLKSKWCHLVWLGWFMKQDPMWR